MAGFFLLGNAAMLEPALPALLELTQDQQTKIGEIVRKAMQERWNQQAPGQWPTTPEARQQRMEQMEAEREKMAQQLSKQILPLLTAGQKALRDKLIPPADKIAKAMREKIRAQMQKPDLDPQQRRAAFQAARQQAQAEYAKVLDQLLTAAQKQKLEAAKKQLREQMQNWRRQQGAGGQGGQRRPGR